METYTTQINIKLTQEEKKRYEALKDKYSHKDIYLKGIEQAEKEGK